jgi:hypothetical protein
VICARASSHSCANLPVGFGTGAPGSLVGM